MYRSARIVSLHTAFALILTAGTALAGPLNPPAGPITSTYKTLTEVEPRTPISTAGFTITQPGSYYLTRNLLPVAQRGVVIQADNVTLDLNGFVIDGAGVSDDGILVGFAAFGGQKNVVIKNGTIRNTVKEGIDAFGNSNVRIENITVDTAIDGFGIIVGDFAVVSNCVIRGTGAGVLAGNNSVISDCVADGRTGEVGIAAGENSTVRNCVSSNGKRGFRVGANSVIEACTAASNTGTGPEDGIGFLVGAFSRVINCTARNNSGTAATGGSGFRVGEGGTLTGCIASGNTPNGFNLGSNSVVIGCNANRNASHGFVVTSTGTRIETCNATLNGGSGILVDGATRFAIERSSITGNGQTGILIQGTSSVGRIDSNVVSTPGGTTAPILISAGSSQGVITNNTITGERAVVIDGARFRITGNHLAVTLPAFSNSGGGAPPASNLIGPIVTSATIGTATNPFANTQ